jgi:hypothetical protein
MDKIKSIRDIKGYHVVNSEIFYHVDFLDKNGQTLFVPPLPAETVLKMDRAKVAMFLQDSLIRGIEQPKEATSSKKVK